MPGRIVNEAPAALGFTSPVATTLLAMMGIFELMFGLAFFAIAVLGTIFWIWMLVDCATKETDAGNNKIVWVVIIALTHWIGAAIYYFVRRPQRIAETGR
jgi:hypothetical protein